MSRIFISYRRADSQAYTDRIHDRLVREFGFENVFQDVEFGNIPIGADFPAVLREQVSSCEVVLVIIGSQWTEVREQDNPQLRRIFNLDDFVYIEVNTALDRHDRREALVIPVVVGDAEMPSAKQLPDNLKRMAVLNAHHVRPNPDFHRDMEVLVGAIQKHFLRLS